MTAELSDAAVDVEDFAADVRSAEVRLTNCIAADDPFSPARVVEEKVFSKILRRGKIFGHLECIINLGDVSGTFWRSEECF